jgi:hypothetical protein
LQESFVTHVLDVFELKPRASATVINAVMVGSIELKANPAKLAFTFFAYHMIAPIYLLNWRPAGRAFPKLPGTYLILNCEYVLLSASFTI